MTQGQPSRGRRRFLRTTLGGVGAAALGHTVPRSLMAQDFPSRNINVVVPTAEGGGADRNLRAFTAVWQKYLPTSFEPSFYPGASGRVGYEFFMGKRDADCYNLLFGNMGPEVLNWVVQKPTFNIDDYFYFARVDTDPGCLFVAADSPFRSIDDVVAEAKKRPLNTGTSRLAHPASIGCLLLGEHTGGQFNLVPLAGGKKTVAGVVTGEMDISVLTSGSVAAAGDAVRTLLVFDNKNAIGPALDNAPTMNDHFGTKIPRMLSSRAFAIHKAAADKYPDRYQALRDSIGKVFDDPAYKESVLKTKGYWEYVNYGGPEECAGFVKDMLALGERFKGYLTGATG